MLRRTLLSLALVAALSYPREACASLADGFYELELLCFQWVDKRLPNCTQAKEGAIIHLRRENGAFSWALRSDPDPSGSATYELKLTEAHDNPPNGFSFTVADSLSVCSPGHALPPRRRNPPSVDHCVFALILTSLLRNLRIEPPIHSPSAR